MAVTLSIKHVDKDGPWPLAPHSYLHAALHEALGELKKVALIHAE